MTTSVPPKTDPWTWPEEVWRRVVDHVRAGRSLKPANWKDGAGMAAQALPDLPAANGRS